tara:strand:+ start:298 stop:1536 length:1239 start_codon:yes stop_codon:yes gene_type:complete
MAKIKTSSAFHIFFNNKNTFFSSCYAPSHVACIVMPKSKKQKRKTGGVQGKRHSPSTYWKIVFEVFDYGHEGDQGNNTRNNKQIALRYGVSPRTVKRVLKRFKNSGEAVPKRWRKDLKNPLRTISEDQATYLKKLITLNPQMFLWELRFQMELEFTGYTFTQSRLCRAFRQMRITYKTLQHVAAERNARDVAEFSFTIKSYDPKDLVYIDESSFNNKTSRRRRGRSASGQPAIRTSLLGYETGITLFGALGCNGMIAKACKTVEVTVDFMVLLRWMRDDLLPNLPPGSILVLDNAGIHHHNDIKLLLKKAVIDPKCSLVRVLYLPAYCPIYNPIERCFGQIKRSLRMRSRMNNIDLKRAIAATLFDITPTNARNYYRAAGATIDTIEQERMQTRRAVESVIGSVFAIFVNNL